MVVVILSVYVFPYLATTIALKSDSVPFSFAPDLSFYLNLSVRGRSNVNAYFGTPAHSALGYSTFDLAFRPFALLIRLVHNNLWTATLIWNLFWWTLTCVGAIWFLRLALDESRDEHRAEHPAEPVRRQQTLAVWLGMPLLFFFNFGVVKSLLVAWLHFPSLARFAGLSLPDIRTVFPQTAIALLFFYLALQVRVLRRWRWYDLAAMSCLQLLGLGTFPYLTMLMAITTGVAILADLKDAIRKDAIPLRRLAAVAGYAVVCAVLDLGYLRLRLAGASQGQGPGLISFHLSRISGLFGGALFLLVALTLATAMLPSIKAQGTKWTIVGLGVANSLLMLGDLVFSPALLISHHAGYFIHTTISLQSVYLIAAFFSRLNTPPQWLKPVSIAAIALITLNGMVLAFVSYRDSLPQNRTTSEVASALRSADLMDHADQFDHADQGLTASDLVLARAESVDDSCAWVPLFSPSTVLFCRSAEYQLSAEEKHGIYRERQALYLYFSGKDSAEIARDLSDSANSAEQDRLVLAGEISPADKDATRQVLATTRAELVPLIVQAEQRSETMRQFFSPYGRVLVLNQPGNPAFDRSRLSQYLSVERETRVGNVVLLWCKPL
jgi:hypothetical protein